MTQPPQLPPPSPFPVLPSHGSATAALILGIVGLTLVPGAGIVAWYMGNKAQQEMDANPGVGWSNYDHAKIGKILGMVGTAYLAFIVLLVVCYFGVVILAFAGMAGTT